VGDEAARERRRETLEAIRREMEAALRCVRELRDGV
jgi:hypothetical protein